MNFIRTFLSHRKHALKQEKKLQEQRSKASRAFDLIALTGFFCSLFLLFIVLQLINKMNDMSLAQDRLIAAQILSELQKTNEFSDQQSLIALDAAMKAYEIVDYKTEYRIYDFKRFFSDVIFYNKENNMALKEAYTPKDFTLTFKVPFPPPPANQSTTPDTEKDI